MEIKISIIVSVYNDEKHIERCLKSVINQTYSNYELDIIDDGSTDRTPFILAKYNNKYKQIRLSTLPNQGLGNARNYLLNNATGDYILFLDSDDELLPNCLYEICNEINKNKTDIVVFSSKIIFSDEKKPDKKMLMYYKRPEPINNKTFTTEDFYNKSIQYMVKYGYGYPAVVWAYAYKRQTNSDLRFLQKTFEDEYFTTALLLLNPTQKIKYINKNLHIHYIRNGAITTSPMQVQSIRCCLDAINSLLELSEKLTNPDTIKSMYINIRHILTIFFIRNQSLNTQKLSPIKIIGLLLKPDSGKSVKTTGPIYRALLKTIINDIVKIYKLHSDQHAAPILMMVNKVLDS